MKAAVRLAGAVLLLGLVNGDAARAASPYINMTETAYSPAAVNVGVNDDVFWCNPSNQDHDVHADDGSFIKDFPAHSQCSGRTFQQAGSFPYHCTIVAGMRGTVTVGAPTTTRAAATTTTTGRTTTTTKRVTTTRAASSAITTTSASVDATTTITEFVTSSTSGQFAIKADDNSSGGPPLAAPMVGAMTLIGIGYLAYRWRYPRTP